MLPATFPDLRAIDLFVAVVRLGSVSRAAQEHGISQPSASGRLRTLERQLGVKLLSRGPGGSVPTDEGILVAEWAGALLRSAGEFASSASSLKERQRGRLRLVASFTVAEYLLVAWMTRFLRSHSSVSVTLDVANSVTVAGRLRAGVADLGFIESPTVPEGLTAQVVAYDELIVVARPDHPWVEVGVLSVDVLLQTPLVLRERGSGTRQVLEDAAVSAGYAAPRASLELGSTAAVRSAVLDGSGPTVVSRLAAGEDLATGTLVEVPVEGIDLTRQLRAVWLTETGPSSMASLLLAQIPALEHDA